MSIMPVGRRVEMVGQMFKLANDQFHQPESGSAYMTAGSENAQVAPSADHASASPESSGEAGSDAASFHDVVYKELEALGIDSQIISRKSNSLIKFEEDIDSGKMSGSFLVPVELPDGKTVSHAQAKQIATNVFDHFGLKGKIGRDEKRKFYIISFATKEAEAIKATNEGSLANLPDNESEKKNTTASVQYEMLSMRKAMLVDALKKGGYIR